MGAYTAILRRTPDHEDFVTATDSEVLCRVVGRWVGQGRKASLVNTTDADILEYILTKLTVRIEAKSRTFLVKVKEHRWEPLNEGADDLAEAGREMEKEGETPGGKKGQHGWCIHSTIGANKWRKGLFEERSKDTDVDQQMQDQNWRSDTPANWDMIATGKWMQKAAWNRWVTTLERDQSHKTPITSTWTADFLTREGEGRKAVGDWLRDKTISWKARSKALSCKSYQCTRPDAPPRSNRKRRFSLFLES